VERVGRGLSLSVPTNAPSIFLLPSRPMRRSVALLLFTLACDPASLADVDAGHVDEHPDAHVPDCVGDAPSCLFEGDEGCEGPRFDASCIDGTWSCDPCTLGDPHCDDPRDTRRARDCER